MARLSIAIYRLPTPRAAQVGTVRVVVDRNGQLYVAGSKVIDAAPSGEFLALTLANDQIYYVKQRDYEQLRAGTKKRQ